MRQRLRARRLQTKDTRPLHGAYAMYEVTILTQIPIRDESSRDEEEIVYGLLLCLGQSWRKVLRSISAEEKKNANLGQGCAAAVIPPSHYYNSVP
eukprot:1702120-Amphidinium_carterae.1